MVVPNSNHFNRFVRAHILKHNMEINPIAIKVNTMAAINIDNVTSKSKRNKMIDISAQSFPFSALNTMESSFPKLKPSMF